VLILDTDHFSELVRESEAGQRLAYRLDQDARLKAITIVTLEEQARGWLARIKNAKQPDETMLAYALLQRLFAVAADWLVQPWDARAVIHFDDLRARRVRISTTDLRIAAISMASGARLLSRNLKDFRRIDGLDVEDWLN
jgi:tRNA(fMet)-specific endonuclease VapC